MSRILVAVDVKPFKTDSGSGVIELTYKDSRPATVEIVTTTGRHYHQGVEEFTETKTVEFQTRDELDWLLAIYAPDA